MLGAPPAFVLSQDQTLNLIILKLLYRSNKLFSEQLWRFVQIALLLWITCLDFQKKSGFSFIRIYCLIFKFLVKSHLISHHSYWRISLDSSIGKISLSWKAVFRDSFVIISCRFLFVKRFFEVFWKSFLRKLSASQQTSRRTSQTLSIRIVHRYNFQATFTFDSSFLSSCLTRQLVYNTTGRKICQRFFEDLERWVKTEKFRVGICGNGSISFRKAVKKV